jgi:hypothetical protein
MYIVTMAKSAFNTEFSAPALLSKASSESRSWLNKTLQSKIDLSWGARSKLIKGAVETYAIEDGGLRQKRLHGGEFGRLGLERSSLTMENQHSFLRDVGVVHPNGHVKERFYGSKEFTLDRIHPNLDPDHQRPLIDLIHERLSYGAGDAKSALTAVDGVVVHLGQSLSDFRIAQSKSGDRLDLVIEYARMMMFLGREPSEFVDFAKFLLNGTPQQGNENVIPQLAFARWRKPIYSSETTDDEPRIIAMVSVILRHADSSEVSLAVALKDGLRDFVAERLSQAACIFSKEASSNADNSTSKDNHHLDGRAGLLRLLIAFFTHQAAREIDANITLTAAMIEAVNKWEGADQVGNLSITGPIRNGIKSFYSSIGKKHLATGATDAIEALFSDQSEFKKQIQFLRLKYKDKKRS